MSLVKMILLMIAKNITTMKLQVSLELISCVNLITINMISNKHIVYWILHVHPASS